MSSIDIYLTLYGCANVNPDDPLDPDRDRIVVSHGHTSAGVYAALGRLGFFDIDGAISQFRRSGTRFEGHVEHGVPGVEWSTGNLGQGLSAGCGFALAARMLEKDFHVFVVMSDGEQQKGQVSEARRFAAKYGLNNITVIIDYNKLQLSGSLSEIMPQNIRDNYLSDGWEVIETDGHDHQEIFRALRQAVSDGSAPVAIFAHTTMGKGVSFMEDRVEFHGKPLSPDQCRAALSELGLADDLEKYIQLREQTPSGAEGTKRHCRVKIDVGSPRTYGRADKTDNRSAWGNALEDLGRLNCGRRDRTPIAVFDCDLVGSVKTGGFAKVAPDCFLEGGIQEHNTATIAGALSTQGILVFFSDFGVFEPQPLHGVVELDVHAQIVGIEFELVTVEQATVFVDIQDQVRNSTV